MQQEDWNKFIMDNFRYDAETGGLWWKTQSKNNQRILNRTVGVLGKDGYLRVTTKKNRFVKTHLVHRICWYLIYNSWPKVLDHKDGNPLNNRLSNLREASSADNQANQKKQSKQTSSFYKGVYLFKRDNKWMAYINREGKRYHLGYFNSQEEAAVAYDKKAKDLFGEFAKLNFPEDIGN